MTIEGVVLVVMPFLVKSSSSTANCLSPWNKFWMDGSYHIDNTSEPYFDVWYDFWLSLVQTINCSTFQIITYSHANLLLFSTHQLLHDFASLLLISISSIKFAILNSKLLQTTTHFFNSPLATVQDGFANVFSTFSSLWTEKGRPESSMSAIDNLFASRKQIAVFHHPYRSFWPSKVHKTSKKFKLSFDWTFSSIDPRGRTS